ncbi:MAG: glycosyltransferase family 39 protein, partial [Anaerolineales bacterium]|nr:glycosyltransferase family 39 protein [Anaerolineales bacterium]
MSLRKHTLLWVILLLYLVLGTLFAVYTPAWQAPDEPAHYNYVRQLAMGHWPVMELGDYDEAYKNEAIGSGFAPEYDVSLITYEDWQPPLYYLLLTPVFWLTGGSLLALRLVSVLLGAGVVALAYAVARRLFPERREVAVGTAVFAAFLPQHLSILASVNNDALAELLIAGILFLL